MSYPHRPYGYDPAHCPVMGLVPTRRSRHAVTVDCVPDDGQPSTANVSAQNAAATIGRIAFPFGDIGANQFGSSDVENMIMLLPPGKAGGRHLLCGHSCAGGARTMALIRPPRCTKHPMR